MGFCLYIQIRGGVLLNADSNPHKSKACSSARAIARTRPASAHARNTRPYTAASYSIHRFFPQTFVNLSIYLHYFKSDYLSIFCIALILSIDPLYSLKDYLSITLTHIVELSIYASCVYLSIREAEFENLL